MKKSKSNKKEDVKELVNEERINSHISKRKKELSKKLNSKRLSSDIKIMTQIEGEALQLLEIQLNYIGILSSYKFKILEKSLFTEKFSIDLKEIDPEWDILEVFETPNKFLLFNSPRFIYQYSLKNENKSFNMTFIKKIDIPLNKAIKTLYDNISFIMTLYDNNSFIIADQENGKLSINNNDTLEEKKQIETKIENLEYIFYINEEKLLIISDKSNKLHIFKDEKEIKVIKDCFASSVNYDNGFLICCYMNIIYVLNLKNFVIEKKYEGFVRDENNCDDLIEGFNEEKNKKFYGYGDEIRNIIKVKNDYWFLCSNETPDPYSDSCGIICLLDKDFKVIREYRQMFGYFRDALKINDNIVCVPANEMLLNIQIINIE